MEAGGFIVHQHSGPNTVCWSPVVSCLHKEERKSESVAVHLECVIKASRLTLTKVAGDTKQLLMDIFLIRRCGSERLALFRTGTVNEAECSHATQRRGDA